MKRMRIFIDLDDVLMDTKSFKGVYFDALSRFGVSKNVVQKTYLEARGNKEVYNLNDHLRDISKSTPGLDMKDAERELLAFPKRAAEFIFPDAVPFLTFLLGNNWNIELISTGDKRIQWRKIKALGIKNFFTNINFSDSDRKSKWVRKSLHNPRDFFVFIDDKAEVVDDIKKEFPESMAIQILRRGNQKKSAVADVVVKNLKEAREILSEKYAKKEN